MQQEDIISGIFEISKSLTLQNVTGLNVDEWAYIYASNAADNPSGWDDRFPAYVTAINTQTKVVTFDRNIPAGYYGSTSFVEQLTQRGRLEREYVLEVVGQTRTHWNVIYEVMNEPKGNANNSIEKWHREVIGWIKRDYGRDTGDVTYGFRDRDTTNHLVSVVNFEYAPVDQIFDLPEVDIISRHGCYNAWSNDPPLNANSDCNARIEPENLRPDWQSILLASDANNFSDKVKMADTDGLHRGAGGGIGWGQAWIRDFDQNMRDMCYVAHQHSGIFVTKETIAESESLLSEVDCTTDNSGSFCGNGDQPYHDPDNPRTLGSYNSNCDDDLIESVGPFISNFTGYDSPLLNDSINGFPAITVKKPFVRLGGFGYDRSLETPSGDYLINIFSFGGNIFGNARGNGIPCWYYLWGNPELYTSDNDLSNMLSTAVNFPSSDSNTCMFQLPIAPSLIPALEGDHLLAIQEKRTGYSSDYYPFLKSNFDPPQLNYPHVSASINNVIPILTTPPDAVGDSDAWRRDDIDDLLKRRVPRLSQSRDANIPVIALAGYNYTKLTNTIGGTLQFYVILFDPGDSATTDMNIITFPPANPDDAHINVNDFGGWNSVPVEEDNEIVGYARYKTFFWGIDSNNALQEGNYLVNVQIQNNVFYPSSRTDRWPYITIEDDKNESVYYVSEALGSYNGNGTKINPFKTIQKAIIEIGDTGSMTNPIRIKVLDGDYQVSYYSPIAMNPFTIIEGVSFEKSRIVLSKKQNYNGEFIVMSDYCRIENMGIEVGIACEKKIASIFNSYLSVQRVLSSQPVTAALSVSGFGYCTVHNSIFRDCDLAVVCVDDASINVHNCNFAGCEDGIDVSDNTHLYCQASIFMDNQDIPIYASDSAEIISLYNCYWPQQDLISAGAQAEIQSAGNINSDPLFVNASADDFKLTQATISEASEITSPCVDAAYFHPFVYGTTRADGGKDDGNMDIGYHYPYEPFKYIIPRFLNDTDWTAEIAVQNPNDYPLNIEYSYYELDGTLIGSVIEMELPAHATHLFDDVPAYEGSLEITADGPIMGSCRSEEETVSTGRNSFTTQIQRALLADNDLSSTGLSVGNWSANWGGGTNTVVTEFVVKNYHDVPVTIQTGKFYEDDGTEIVGARIYNLTLDAHETFTYLTPSPFYFGWGSFEVEASKPLVGEVLFHCQNNTSGHNFSEALVMVPEQMYSSELDVPCLHLGNYGDMWEDFVLIKNPMAYAVSIEIDFYHDDGTQFNPQPFPNPVSINAKANFCFGTWETFPTYGIGSARISVQGAGKIIGHNEILGVLPYGTSNLDMVIAGCELNHRYSSPHRFFAPYCHATNNSSDYEESYLVITNHDAMLANTVEVRFYGMNGSPSRDAEIYEMPVNGMEIIPIIADPGETLSVSLEIQSDAPISGWLERFWSLPTGTDHWYDANLLQYW